MKKKLFLISTFCFFGPLACFGMDSTTTTTTTTRPATVIETDVVTFDATTTDVSTSVQNSFVNDPNLAPFAGKVMVRVDSNGVVTLTGSAPSEKVKFDFENKANTVDGVAKVVNNIEVKRVSQ